MHYISFMKLHGITHNCLIYQQIQTMMLKCAAMCKRRKPQVAMHQQYTNTVCHWVSYVPFFYGFWSIIKKKKIKKNFNTVNQSFLKA